MGLAATALPSIKNSHIEFIIQVATYPPLCWENNGDRDDKVFFPPFLQEGVGPLIKRPIWNSIPVPHVSWWSLSIVWKLAHLSEGNLKNTSKGQVLLRDGIPLQILNGVQPRVLVVDGLKCVLLRLTSTSSLSKFGEEFDFSRNVLSHYSEICNICTISQISANAWLYSFE